MSGESLQIPAFNVGNGYAPLQGSRCCPLNIDFTSAQSQAFDFVAPEQGGIMDIIQCAWIDNRDVNARMTILVGLTNQRLIIPANVQGVFPVITPMPARFIISLAAVAAVTSRILFMNAPQPIGVWGP